MSFVSWQEGANLVLFAKLSFEPIIFNLQQPFCRGQPPARLIFIGLFLLFLTIHLSCLQLTQD